MPESPLTKQVDTITNEVMDVIRDFLGFSPDDEEGNIADIIANKLSDTPADFDDDLYHFIHSKIKEILPNLIQQ